MIADEIKETFTEYVNSWTNEVLMKSIEGATLGVLNKACKTTERRHLVLKALTGHLSSKELHTAQMWALYRLVQPEKVGGHWTTLRGEMELEQICNTLISSLDAQEGQLSFTDAINKAESEGDFDKADVLKNNRDKQDAFEEAWSKPNEDTHLSFEDDLEGYEPPF